MCSTGQMVLWRFKPEMGRSLVWEFGFVGSRNGDLLRMGYYNGDFRANRWVKESEIETQPHRP